MSKNQLLVCSALVAAGALASPAAASPALKVERGAVVTAAAATDPVGFEVFLPLRNQAAMAALLKAQQTPGSPQYHQWLTPAQFAAQFGPTAASLASLKATLAAAGLTVTATHSQSVHVAGDVQHAAALLQTSLAKVTQPSGSSRLLATKPATLPSALKAQGAMIAAFANTPPRRATSVRGVLASAAPDNRYTASGAYWFDDGKQAYSYPAYTNVTPLPGGYNRVNVTNGYGVKVAVLMSDLIFPGDVPAAFNHENFTAISGAPIPTINTVLVNGGGTFGGGGSFEASLDVQQVTGGAPGSNVTLVSIPDLSDANILEGYTYIVESNAYAIVNSSFGGCELEYTAAYNGGVDYTGILLALHDVFVQGNLQGITFVASSGDQGAPMCPGPNYAPGVDAIFGLGVSNPADDPNVTAVGGGNLITSHGPGLNSTYVRESAFGDPEYPYDIYGIGANVSGGYWAAGGGVSSVFPKPDYQNLVGTGSSSWRTVPDVGMQVGGLGFSQLNGSAPGFCNSNAISCSADDSSVITAYGVDYGGGFYYTIGTSVSSPEFVGALALYEQRTGRQGNVNYFLYTQGAAQTAAGGVSAPAAQRYYHRGQPGFDGYYSGNYPSANYDYIYGNGSPNVDNLFGLTPYGVAGTPQTKSNP
jgi:subtilase family serine protease